MTLRRSARVGRLAAALVSLCALLVLVACAPRTAEESRASVASRNTTSMSWDSKPSSAAGDPKGSSVVGSASSTSAVTSPSTDASIAIRAQLDTWCGGVNNHHLDEKMSVYADVISPFFGKTTATKAQVRRVFASPFSRWRRMRQHLETVDVDVRGERATVRLYKTWRYDGHPGWAEERLSFTHTSRGWLITSEQDIRASE
jgi:hypothetical protein